MSELRLAPGPGRFAWINAAAWADPHIDLLIAHPDDRNRTSVGPLD
jgi:hypothetical protein